MAAQDSQTLHRPPPWSDSRHAGMQTEITHARQSAQNDRLRAANERDTNGEAGETPELSGLRASALTAPMPPPLPLGLWPTCKVAAKGPTTRP